MTVEFEQENFSMNSKHLLITLGVTSLSVLGCKSSPEYDAAAGRRPDDSPANTIPAVSPGATGVAAHHDERPGAAAPVGSVGTTVTSALRTGDGKDRDAEATFQSVPSMKIVGDAEFDEVANGVKIEIEVANALPGLKGIHIHQTDDCSDIANKSMGDHFAPTTHKHGLPTAPEHHLGDLGNITINQDGKGKLEIVAVGANLKPGDPLSFIGKSIVLHESDDKGTGASGDSGKPIACGPIRED